MIANVGFLKYENGETIRYTHAGGVHLYHFDATACGLIEPRYNVTNVVFFANSEKHALQVLKDYFNACKNIGLLDRDDHCGFRPSIIKHYLDNFDKVKVSLVDPKNSGFMSVAWAGNEYFA